MLHQNVIRLLASHSRCHEFSVKLMRRIIVHPSLLCNAILCNLLKLYTFTSSKPTMHGLPGFNITEQSLIGLDLRFHQSLHVLPGWIKISSIQARSQVFLDWASFNTAGNKITIEGFQSQQYCVSDWAGLRFQQFTSRPNYVYSPAWSCKAAHFPNKCQNCCHSRLSLNIFGLRVIQAKSMHGSLSLWPSSRPSSKSCSQSLTWPRMAKVKERTTDTC